MATASRSSGWWMVCAMLCVGGCGGGSNHAESLAPASPPSATRTTTLIISVTDLIGAPVAGASVSVQGPEAPLSPLVTDGNGLAAFTAKVGSRLYVWASKTDPDLLGDARIESVPDAAVVRSSVFVRPRSTAPGGISGASVVRIGEDGRSLEFALTILQVPYPVSDRESLRPDDVRVMACSPDGGNDVRGFQPDCVAGNDEFDAAYDGFDSGRALALEKVPGPGYDAIFRPTFSSILLLDQSASAAAADPADERLFAAKYFLTWSNVEHVVGLAAFAVDDALSGRLALLPQKPVTIFPLENPSLTVAGRSLFSAVDSLGALEGGVAPLYAALDRTVDFAAARPEEVAAIVVVTDGRDLTCGARSECRARREAVLQKSRDKKVAIMTVGMASPTGAVDREALGALSLASGATSKAAFWVTDPRQLSGVVAVALLHQQDRVESLRARFQIQSTAPGTFVSGRTVLGWVRLRSCIFWEGCSEDYLPFAVTIP